MAKTQRYISSHFGASFLMIFGPFFAIISLIYLIKISAITSKIELSLGEIFRLYLYSTPDILFYTLPLSFVGALSSSLAKLSEENELIALFSLGYSPKSLMRYLLISALLFSMLLSVVSLWAMPLTKQLYRAFKEQKIKEAKLNIDAGKLGQKFGDFYIYIKSKNQSSFNDVVIYAPKINNETFIASNYGKLHHNHSITSLELLDGYGYSMDNETLQEIGFRRVEFFQQTRSHSFNFQNAYEYWSKYSTNKRIKKRLLFFLFISLMPIFILYFVASYTIINPRYSANRSSIVTLLAVAFTYGYASFIEKRGSIELFALSVGLILIGGLVSFHYKIKRRF